MGLSQMGFVPAADLGPLMEHLPQGAPGLNSHLLLHPRHLPVLEISALFGLQNSSGEMAVCHRKRA